MAATNEPIARIRLARSRSRLLAVPIALALAGAGAVGVGLLVAQGTAGLVLAALGGLVMLGGLVGAVLLLSVRLEVAESAVSLTWLGGRRAYGLVPGPVTRVQLRGRRASTLRPRSGALGWGIGPARLRGEEEIELVRLAATPTAILIPTDRGRLAIAPANEQDLLEALAHAAQARQRAEAAEEKVAEERAAEPDPDLEAAPPSALTGIERALLEERLARERDEARRAVMEAQLAASSMATTGPQPGAPPATVPLPAARRRSLGLARPRAGWAFVLMPTAAAAIAWWIGMLVGGIPEPGTDLARLTSLGLVLAGPATSVGAIMTLAWWPRLVGVIVAGGLAATIFIGRSFIG
jgi:hypothetical protein